jgi:hypothetical protein
MMLSSIVFEFEKQLHHDNDMKLEPPSREPPLVSLVPIMRYYATK